MKFSFRTCSESSHTAKLPRRQQRILHILHMVMSRPKVLSLERARYFTRSMRMSNGQSLSLRWARAMVHIMENMEIAIIPGELIVGRAGPIGRYGIFYPELECDYFARPEILSAPTEVASIFSPADLETLHTELLPYWQGRTYHEGVERILPSELKSLLYHKNDSYSPSFILLESATLRHSLQWVPDYAKVINLGFQDVEARAKQALENLEIKASTEKQEFYRGIILLCQGIKTFATRYAMLADQLASTENSAQRREELWAIAERCRQVPYYPARNFAEAVQAQWFTQLISRLEQVHGGNVSNGRIDQYLYRLYQQDVAAQILTPDLAKEYLGCLWLNMSQFLRLQPTPGGFKMYQDHAHWECTTIGGQDSSGRDASNELSQVILESALEFPLDYPYLAVRIHKHTPEDFLSQVSAAIRQGQDIPVLLNDEEIIPNLQRKGASLAEARDYAGSGFSEARLSNRSTYMTGSTWLNLVSALEMALQNGSDQGFCDQKMGLRKGEFRQFRNFEELWQAFANQVEYLLEQVFRQQDLVDNVRHEHLAAPFLSALHDLCMQAGKDINEGHFPMGLNPAGNIGPVGFATVIDSLAAIKDLVFERQVLTLSSLYQAMLLNFEGFEIIRQQCLRAPKFGNGHPEADALALRLDTLLVGKCQVHRNLYGGIPDIFYVPVTGHIAMGHVTGATANGRRAGEALSYGFSPTWGCSTQGPGVVLHSLAKAKAKHLTARGSYVLTLDLSPQSLSAKAGLVALNSLIRLWCEQKHWYLKVHIVNNNDLIFSKNTRWDHFFIRAPGFNAGCLPLPKSLLESVLVPRIGGNYEGF